MSAEVHGVVGRDGHSSLSGGQNIVRMNDRHIRSRRVAGPDAQHPALGPTCGVRFRRFDHAPEESHNGERP